MALGLSWRAPLPRTAVELARRGVILGLALAGLFAAARAEKAPSSTDELTAAADHIVEGTVEIIRADRTLEWPWEYVRYHAVVKISAAAKGGDFVAGNWVGCRYWTRHWRAPTSPPPDTNGHWPLPRSGQKARVYLVADGYNGFGQTTDGGYDVFGRNGWEILSPSADPGGEGTFYDSLDSDWRRSAFGFLAGGIGLLCIAWYVRRRRRK
ncbi:MAG: hypothetical protein JNL28_12695 [Planctomycetes bacterium]|nr:hypothetical protein [Planctomycetota bacterium]